MITLMNLVFSSKALSCLAGALLCFSNCRTTAPVKPAKPGKDTTVTTTPATPTNPPATTAAVAGTPLKNMFGVNTYEWDFLYNPADPNNHNAINESNMALLKTFSSIRHYMNWNKLENTEGNYTYNPTNDGSWNYDMMYTRCKQEGILVLADLKNCPRWMLETYPAADRDDENVPAPYGADLSKPASYIQHARTAFQFAARYGTNTNVDRTLVKVDTRPRWTGDRINKVEIGLGLVRYIECNNEQDRWWKGPYTTQTAEQYAANLSAFYDGHKGTLGKNVGVKTADPNMLVVMGGTSTLDPNYVSRMVAWCRTNRGLKADGSVNLCFDVVNFHYYCNDGSVTPRIQAKTGVAPELSKAAALADGFLKVAKEHKLPCWVTESGYDINQGSYQKAPPIGSKSALLVQADWNLRTSLLYARRGIERLFFYQLFDAHPNDPTQFSTSGLNEAKTRRPTADYMLQTIKLMGSYVYQKTLSTDPIVDVYKLGNKTMYILVVPDSKNRTATYTLDLGAGAVLANLYSPKAGADAMTKTTASAPAGKLKITVTETPVFVEAISAQ